MSHRNRSSHTALTVVSLAAAAVLAACSGGDGESTAGSAPSSSGTVSIADIDGRSVLVDADGLPVYTSDEEQASGEVLCLSDGCVGFWKPVTTDTDMPTGDVDGALGTITRPDETEQVTLDGTPLYTFSNDSPGEVSGDGLSDTFDGQTLSWHVVTADGSTVTTENQSDGYDY